MGMRRHGCTALDAQAQAGHLESLTRLLQVLSSLLLLLTQPAHGLPLHLPEREIGVPALRHCLNCLVTVIARQLERLLGLGLDHDLRVQACLGLTAAEAAPALDLVRQHTCTLRAIAKDDCLARGIQNAPLALAIACKARRAAGVADVFNVVNCGRLELVVPSTQPAQLERHCHPDRVWCGCRHWLLDHDAPSKGECGLVGAVENLSRQGCSGLQC
mmetsp:Transcript_64551/g.166148  ORF Transcript_64551/g.166148 Transcript_64551/m.166148 type:complete len:216 (-) Transcript_64551:2049-2696(-)